MKNEIRKDEAENSMYTFCYSNNGLATLHRQLVSIDALVKYSYEYEDLAYQLMLEKAKKHLNETIECIELAYKRAKELNN